MNLVRTSSAESVTVLCNSLDATTMRRVRRLLSRYERDPLEVDDLLQDALFEAVRCVHSYDGRAPIHSWFAGVAVNVARHHVARKVRERAVISDFDIELLDRETEQTCPLRAFASKQLLEKIQVALSQLTPELRRTFEMTCLQEKTYAETAEELGVPVGTVRSRVNRAREILRARADHQPTSQSGWVA